MKKLPYLLVHKMDKTSFCSIHLKKQKGKDDHIVTDIICKASEHKKRSAMTRKCLKRLPSILVSLLSPERPRQ